MFNPEQLENRRLLSVSVAFDPSTGSLQVFDKASGSDLRVTMYNTDAPPTRVLGKRVVEPIAEQQYNGMLRGVSVYDHDELIFNNGGKAWIRVQSIDISTGNGDDQIAVYAWNSPITTRVNAADGKDTITATAHQAALPLIYGEGGDDVIGVTFSDSGQFRTIDAGAGNDTITAIGGRVFDNLPTFNDGAEVVRTVETRLILGGDGNDTVNLALQFGDAGTIGYHVMAGAGDDVINGSDKIDQLFGDDGSDQIFAGAGDDYLNGGLGNDYLSGQDGDDFLDHGGGADVLIGGDGHDCAIVCCADKTMDIEDLIMT